MDKSTKRNKEIVLIDHIRRVLKTQDPSVVVPIGDDAAAVKSTQGLYLLYTCDMVVESVHFKKNEDPKKIGYKALAVSVSDIAAMGGKPRWALVSVCLPAKNAPRIIKELVEGIKSCAHKFDISIIGGDMNKGVRLVVDVFMIGEVEKDSVVLRSTAKHGDYIFVSGPLGGSLKRKHLSFTPRLREARFLVKNFKINSMMDLSDGLGMDLNRLVKASKVGAFIFENKIPVSPQAKGINSALFDGEDFELLFTLSKAEALRLFQKTKKTGNFKFYSIGRVTNLFSDVRMIKGDGRVQKIPWRGFKHFK